MRLLEWLRRLRLFLFRDRATRDLEAEMHLHRELRADALHRSGMSAPDAIVTARRRFGHPVTHQEASRDMWGLGSLDDLRQDVRYAGRRLRQRPAFTASVVVVLALGIGATTAMFSAVDAAMLRPLPFLHPEQLVFLPSVRMATLGGTRPPDHIPDLLDIAAMRQTFSHVAGYAVGGLNLADPDHPERLRVGVITPDFFNVLGVAPLVGRGLLPSDGVPGAPLVAILSYQLWQQSFGGTPIVSHTVNLNGHGYDIVGIMPPGLSFPERSQLWVPMSIPFTPATWEAFGLFISDEHVIGRLADTVSLRLARQQVVLRWSQALAAATGTRRANIQTYLDDFRRLPAVQTAQRLLASSRSRALWFLFGAAGLVLLIACANVINLLLTQSLRRRPELTLREVLGAPRRRVVRQLLTETTLLAAAGAAGGIALAHAGLRGVAVLLPAELQTIAPLKLDLRVLTFAAIVGIASGIVSGTLPALRSSRTDPGEVIKRGHQRSSRDASVLRLLLVGGEVALTCLLLIATGLMLRSLADVERLDRGITPPHAASAQMAFARWKPRNVRLRRMTAIAARLRAQPGIIAVGFVNDLPISGDGIEMGVTPGQPIVAATAEAPGAHWLMASPGYFAAIGVRLLHGRDFTDTDDSMAPPVAVVSASLAKRYWPGIVPTGRTIGMGNDPPATIIGVVDDVREHFTGDPLPQLYMPIAATPPNQVSLVVRGTAPDDVLLRQMVAAVRYVDPAQPVYDLRTMNDVLGEAVSPWRTNAALLALFAGLALVMAAFGVFAVVSHAISQRNREFGIRSALGASPAQLVWLPTRQMIAVVGAATLAGVAAAWAARQLAASLLFGVSTRDPVSFLLGPCVTALAAMLATVIPALRAARVNPAEVMRAE